jgi:hypothetical protein
MATIKELVAAERGYPGTFMGFTPNDAAYWREPGLPLAPQLPLFRTSVGKQLYKVADYVEFVFITEDMAPRFPVGTLVTIEPVSTLEALQVGHVYVHLHPTAADELQVGRLAHIGTTSLELTQDNNPVVLTWPLGSTLGAETSGLYEVTYYSEHPTSWGALSLGKAEEAEVYLLEIMTDGMAPRYPRGSRYIIRAVPASRWPQARGVHALEMADGTQLIWRILDQHEGVLTLGTDRTGITARLALAEVTALWKLCEADYMPEESAADSDWWLERSPGAPLYPY